MTETSREIVVQARSVGDAAIIYASDYLNKLSGEASNASAGGNSNRDAGPLSLTFAILNSSTASAFRFWWV